MLAPGQVVGPCELIRQLGAGAFGEVWLVRHIELGVQRAMKIPTDPDYVKQLRKEARIQSGLRHPRVVETFDLNTRGDPPYIVMEYVEGEDLRKRLNARGKLPPREALGIVCQVLEALQAAQEHGILHRDLKPENILIAPDGTVKVADFGLGKVQAEVAQSLILSGSMMSVEGKSVSGTYDYMSPEQRVGAEPGPGDDVYSVGIIGCELLTGSRPAPGIAVGKAFRKAGISEAISDVFEKALEEPEDRYRDAAEMVAAVAPLRAGRAEARRKPSAKLNLRTQPAKAEAVPELPLADETSALPKGRWVKVATPGKAARESRGLNLQAAPRRKARWSGASWVLSFLLLIWLSIISSLIEKGSRMSSEAREEYIGGAVLVGVVLFLLLLKSRKKG